MYESMNMRGRHPTQRQFKAGVPEDGRPLHSGVPGFVRYRDLMLRPCQYIYAAKLNPSNIKVYAGRSKLPYLTTRVSSQLSSEND